MLLQLKIYHRNKLKCQSRWQCGLRRRSAAAGLLGWQLRILLRE